ncbi:unnamed protein product [Orchesella dallaii]|uniref:Endonuclease/exonuclease/phosphatase domain-containing protein n=1 Tax=Orchesella dallaii TaxID=48710 RepID=A0ABP1QHB8_9HEXA
MFAFSFEIISSRFICNVIVTEPRVLLEKVMSNRYYRPPFHSRSTTSSSWDNRRPGSSGSHASSNRVGGAPSQFISNIPSSFHEYHWRSSFRGGGSAVSSSRTSIGTGFSSYAAGGSGSEMEFGGELDENSIVTRNWEQTNLGAMVQADGKRGATGIGSSGTRFTLMSYNVLAPSLLEKHSELYRDCDPAALSWERRVNLLFEEVEIHQPDIFCFQEVEEGQFNHTFLPRFMDGGYRGVFKKKTGDKVDGCAIFYKANKFLAVEKLGIELKQPHVPILDRDNVALLVKLETRSPVKRQKLVVGTTHLLFNPKREDVRLAQTQLLLAELDRLAFCGFDKDGKCLYHPILMTGDFNCKSFGYVTKLFTDGELRYLDENGDLLRLLQRKGFDSVLPRDLGITDQCQHYKVVLERLKRWKKTRVNRFDLDQKVQESLVNIFPYIEDVQARNEIEESETCMLSPPDDLISLMSPVTEGVEPAPSIMETEESQLLSQAAKKIAAIQSGSEPSNSSHNAAVLQLKKIREQAFPSQKSLERLDGRVLAELEKYKQACTFGSGRLSHNLFFRDIHAPKLSRKDNGAVVTTRQQGWICVDYIFQSMTWNSHLNKVIEGRLKLIRRLGLFNRSECKQIGSIPNNDHPSDHFPLIAEFLLRP